jgi:pseudaminic acid cytidylyltransferase
MTIAIIPARGGSKRIPRKNLRNFLGKPILQITIEKILSTQFFTDVYVTTDDQEITSVAQQAGAKVLKRNSYLSGDYATTVEVISNAIDNIFLSRKCEKEIIACIYPVTPFLNQSHIRSAMKTFESCRDGYVFAAQESNHINRSFYLGSNQEIQMMFAGHNESRTQDLPKVYCDAGLFYFGYAKNWLSGKSLFSPESRIIELAKYESVDIDTEDDWAFAEELYKIRNAGKQISYT